MKIVTLALNAMNTRFELVLHGDDPAALRAAGEEALGEIARLESLLSAFRPTSEIAHVNARAGMEAVQVSPEVFALLLEALEWWRLTQGALDITVGPLLRCWGFWGASGRLPEPSAIEVAMGSVGLGNVELNSERRTVRFLRRGMMVDLGSIGKGYAVDRAVELLVESGVRNALLHGGTSTAYGLGCPPDQPAWRTSVRSPVISDTGSARALPEVGIRDEALSVSAVSEKSFSAGGRTYGHVLDPRTGWPADTLSLSLVALPRAFDADAWSTALMVLGTEGLELLKRLRPGARGMVVNLEGDIASVGFPGGRKSAPPPRTGILRLEGQ